MTMRRITRAARDFASRAWRDRRGATAAEFAAIAPMFIALMLGILQVAVVWVAKTELQTATETAARLVFTGQTSSSSYNTETKFLDALCANLPIIFQCSGVMLNLAPQTSMSSVDTSAPTLTYNGAGAVTNTFTYNPGAYGEVMVLQVLYQFPVVGAALFNFSTQSNGTLLMVATVVFENEPQ